MLVVLIYLRRLLGIVIGRNIVLLCVSTVLTILVAGGLLAWRMQ